MAKLSGIFDNFTDLDKLPVADILASLKQRLDPHVIENLIGNLILYPQTVPVSKAEMEIDRAILGQALIKAPNLVWDNRNRKIIITEELACRFPPLIKLISTIIDALKLKEITFIASKEGSLLKTLGTFIPFSVIYETHETKKDTPIAFINNQQRKLKGGIVNIIPIKDKQVTFRAGESKEVFLMGGDLGLLIDLRKI